MKKAALFLVLFLGSASNAFAYDSTGCGLGSLVFKGQKGPVPQVLAVTTNGSFGTQTFGITSNTSGCDSYGRITGGTGRMFAFLENNLDQFAADAASAKAKPSKPLPPSPAAMPKRSAALRTTTLPNCSATRTFPL